MAITIIQPDWQRRIAVVVPIVALALSLFVVYPQWKRYSALQVQIAKKQTELDALKASPLPEPGPVRPAVDQRPSEPPLFLEQVTAVATASGCKLIGFEVVEQGKARAASGLVQPVRSKIDVEGSYLQIRQFLWQLARADRVYVVTELLVENPAPSVQAAVRGPLRATVTIERYVAQALASEPALGS
jgi:hypothetical protein